MPPVVPEGMPPPPFRLPPPPAEPPPVMSLPDGMPGPFRHEFRERAAPAGDRPASIEATVRPPRRGVAASPRRRGGGDGTGRSRSGRPIDGRARPRRRPRADDLARRLRRSALAVRQLTHSRVRSAATSKAAGAILERRRDDGRRSATTGPGRLHADRRQARSQSARRPSAEPRRSGAGRPRRRVSRRGLGRLPGGPRPARARGRVARSGRRPVGVEADPVLGHAVADGLDDRADLGADARSAGGPPRPGRPARRTTGRRGRRRRGGSSGTPRSPPRGPPARAGRSGAAPRGRPGRTPRPTASGGGLGVVTGSASWSPSARARQSAETGQTRQTRRPRACRPGPPAP